MRRGITPAFSLQKTKIPARGLKSVSSTTSIISVASTTSKNQNPREGIEICYITLVVDKRVGYLQKTKIPARGLKLLCKQIVELLEQFTSKNQNPREGIEIALPPRRRRTPSNTSSKNQNPREGIETDEIRECQNRSPPFELQKTKIPARGLKLLCKQIVELLEQFTSKNQNPREGIETSGSSPTTSPYGL